MNSKKVPAHFYSQSSVIPCKIENGRVKLLMISNRKCSRWIFPKGVIEPDLTPQQSAVKEAFEEAGIKGNVFPDLIGEYHYKKWGGTCSVQVFLLQISEILPAWPEDYRTRIWVGIEEAIELVREMELKTILRTVGKRLLDLDNYS